MTAVFFDGQLRLKQQYPIPRPPEGWALTQVLSAGICRTDIELTKGYQAFNGILGHEFVGIVKKADNRGLIGQRVVGEINAACGGCDACRRGAGRHCAKRKVLGIENLNGALADYLILPETNLLPVPENISNDQAVLMEPLAAATQILDQVQLNGEEKVVVLGDGPVGILCAWALATVCRQVTIAGRHSAKLEIARWRHLKTARLEAVEAGVDLVVDATGRADGLSHAIRLCRPQGTIVMKSTVADTGKINLAPLVVNEISLVGSRCGRFKKALELLETHPDIPLPRLISARYSISQALKAFAHAARSDGMKIIIEVSTSAL